MRFASQTLSDPLRRPGTLSAATALTLAMLLVPDRAAAQPAAAPVKPLWEVGAFALGVDQQAYPGAATQVRRALALPYFAYRGEFLRADDNGAGLRAFKTPTFELDVGVAGSFGARSNDIAARRGMPNLGTLFEFGPQLKWNLGPLAGGRLRAAFPLRGVFDLSDGLARRGTAFEPELSFSRRSGGWNYNAGVGAVWGDARLADTFYGVAPRYATASRAAYRAESGLIAWRASASVSRQLTPDLQGFGFVRADSVAGAANAASPLVQRRTGASVGLGLSYTWLKSDARAVD